MTFSTRTNSYGPGTVPSPRSSRRHKTGATPAPLVALLSSDRGCPQFSLPTTRITCVNSSGSRDRKSTRLNSSHLGISYAVFCLKKKNNLQDNQILLCFLIH